MATGWDDHPTKLRLRLAGALALAVVLSVMAVIWSAFEGRFTRYVTLTVITPRSGLVMDPGAKVTFHGVEVGRVSDIVQTGPADAVRAQLTLDIEPRFVELLPSNTVADVTASTVFGNKYVQLRLPPDPTPERAADGDVIEGHHVTTEFNTVFETVTELAEQIDPVRLNMTLSATAEALTGLGSAFGRSLLDGNVILDDLNTRMPQLNRDIVALADLADIYATSSPDLLSALDYATTTAATFNDQQAQLDSILLAATGFGDTAADVFARGQPYFVRVAQDLRPTAQVLDEYSPSLVCTASGFAEAAPLVKAALGDNGYSLAGAASLLGAENPYIYPDNLPRVNASGGPGGQPGCWADIDRDTLWPTPYLVMDTGASIAPYNHFELGQPILTEYVWGRQVGEPTINP